MTQHTNGIGAACGHRIKTYTEYNRMKEMVITRNKNDSFHEAIKLPSRLQFRGLASVPCSLLILAYPASSRMWHDMTVLIEYRSVCTWDDIGARHQYQALVIQNEYKNGIWNEIWNGKRKLKIRIIKLLIIRLFGKLIEKNVLIFYFVFVQPQVIKLDV